MKRKAALMSTLSYYRLYGDFPFGQKCYDNDGNFVCVYNEEFHNKDVKFGFFGCFGLDTDPSEYPDVYVEVEKQDGYYNSDTIKNEPVENKNEQEKKPDVIIYRFVDYLNGIKNE